MSLLSKLLGGSAARAAQAPAEGASRGAIIDGKCWKRVLVPAMGRPYSVRSIELACRLARTSNATVHLAYVMEVPRSMVIEASIPDIEVLAESVLQDGEDVARQYKVPVISSVYRTRNADDGILKLIKEAECDLLVLGARPDEARGLPRDLIRQLFRSAPCEVVLDYIAGEQ
jgi:CIC family chloride channel protein